MTLQDRPRFPLGGLVGDGGGERMKAIRKKPGCEPEVIDVENTLEAFQAEVDGRIEVVTISNDTVIICNEEGRLLGLPHNCRFCGIEFVGTILIVGYAGDTFCDVPEEAFLMKSLRHA